MKFLIKEIKSKKGALHFKRWRIIETKWFSIYIHGIYKRDMDNHLHDHPWSIWTMIVYGSYIEEFMSDDKVMINTVLRRFLHCSRRKANQFHKIKQLISNKVYTLAVVGPRYRNWGYSIEGGAWMSNQDYKDFKRN